jgi:YceI-like protein
MRILPLSATVGFGLVSILCAEAQIRYVPQAAGTTVKIAGTSTAHDWEMEGVAIGGYLELGAGVVLDKAQAAPAGLQGDKLPLTVYARIPVGSIHSKADHLPDVMDNLMQKNMKADNFPLIQYTLTDMTFKAPHAAGQPFNFDAKGDLVIAGKTNKVSFPVVLEPLEQGKIKVTGATSVKMTDYGVDPPTPNFGLGIMKCGDDVKISINWTLKEKTPEKK